MIRALWQGRVVKDPLSDALTLLDGWTREGRQLRRTLTLDDSQHAALTERIKVFADALRLRPRISRTDGQTQIRLDAQDETGIGEGEVALAARIEDAYRTVTSPD